MNKKERLQFIKELVGRFPIDTQEEIVDRLKEKGFASTQATVSRDIKELGIIKVPSADKGYVYGLPRPAHLKTTLQNVRSYERMGQMLTIQLVPGSTSAVKRHITDLFSEVIFSILADDSTILIIARKEEDLHAIEQALAGW